VFDIDIFHPINFYAMYFQEDRSDYIKLLSFLESAHHGSSITPIETSFNASISNLKSQLEKYVVFKCKSGSTRFVEYWVPACLSHLQLEQYCSILLSNLMLLCSGQKTDSVDALHELIISTRKVDTIRNKISNKLKSRVSHIFCRQLLVPTFLSSYYFKFYKSYN